MEHVSRNVRTAAIVASVGGALAVIGSILPWASVRINFLFVNTSQNVNGLDTSDGKITLVAGIVALGAGLAILLARGLTEGARRGVAIVAGIAGLVALGIGIYDAIDISDKAGEIGDIADTASQAAGAQGEQVRALLEQGLDVSLSFGIFVVIAGGLLALVGGALALARGRTEPAGTTGYTAPPQPAP